MFSYGAYVVAITPKISFTVSSNVIVDACMLLNNEVTTAIQNDARNHMMDLRGPEENWS